MSSPRSHSRGSLGFNLPQSPPNDVRDGRQDGQIEHAERARDMKGIRISRTSSLLPHTANPNSACRLTSGVESPYTSRVRSLRPARLRIGPCQLTTEWNIRKEGTELCWLVYGGQIDGHRLSVPAEPDQVVSPARLHPEARDMSRRSCSLADGVEQAPGKTMKENESRGV